MYKVRTMSEWVIKIKEAARPDWMAAFNFFKFKLCELSGVFLTPRDNSIYIGKNAIGEMGKMGFE